MSVCKIEFAIEIQCQCISIENTAKRQLQLAETFSCHNHGILDLIAP